MSTTKIVDPVVRARNAVALAARHGNDQTALRRELAAAKLRRAIGEALADPYPPSPAQRRALALMLSDGAR